MWIDWDPDRLEEVLAQADQVAYESPDLPAEPVVVAEGAGWAAVAPADRIVEEPIYHRFVAERRGYEILGPAPSWIWGTDDWDLVTVDPDSIPEEERRSS